MSQAPDGTGGRTYRVRHRTAYGYDAPVTASYGRACVSPRDVPGQWARQTRVDVEPGPDVLTEHTDFFGNRAAYFEVRTPHTELVITSSSLVEVTRTVPDLTVADSRSWESAARAARQDEEVRRERSLVLPSAHVVVDAQVREFAAGTFTPGRPVGEAVGELVSRIHRDFAYTSGSTTVQTTVGEVLTRREGVCQDFAHVGIAALRSVGLPARYVSGYLETSPPPGQPKLQGSDASHAWLAVWLPMLGWVDLDPTNDKPADASYVVVGWGRDYRDVRPLTGVIHTTSTSTTLSVGVDVERYTPGAAHDPATLTAG